MTSKDSIKRIHVLKEEVITNLSEHINEKDELAPFVNQENPYHPIWRAECDGEVLLQTYSCRSYYHRFQGYPFPLNLLAPIFEYFYIVLPQLQSTLFVSNFRATIVNHIQYNILQFRTTSVSEFLENLQKVVVEQESIPQPVFRKLSMVNQAIFSFFFVLLPSLNIIFALVFGFLYQYSVIFIFNFFVLMVAYSIVSIILTFKFHYNPIVLWKAIGQTSFDLKIQLLMAVAKTVVFFGCLLAILIICIIPFLIVIYGYYSYGYNLFVVIDSYGIISYSVVVAVLYTLYYFSLLLYPSTVANYHGLLKLYFGNPQASNMREQVVILRVIDCEEVKSLLMRLKSSEIRNYQFDASSYVVEGSESANSPNESNRLSTAYQPSIFLNNEQFST